MQCLLKNYYFLPAYYLRARGVYITAYSLVPGILILMSSDNVAH